MAETYKTYAEFENKEVNAFLKNLDKNLIKVKDGHKKYVGLLSAIVYKDVISHFEKEEGSRGPWAKWSTFYKDIMEEQGKGGNKILQDSGKLRQNFKPQNYKKVTGGFLWFNDAKTKSNFPYAAAHDNGGPKLPKRDFMWLSEKAMDDISVQTLQFMIDEGV